MIAVAVAGSQRSDCCGDTSAEQSLSWRLSLTGGWLDGRGDTCTRADVSVSISFVLLSIVLTKVCLMNVSDPDTGRITRAHQTPFQPPGLLQGDRTCLLYILPARGLSFRREKIESSVSDT